MFHLSFFNNAKKLSKLVVLKKFNHNVQLSKEVHILKSQSMNKYPKFLS